MKDVELVVQLLLLVEVGVKAYSQAELDEEYSRRDEEWANRTTVERDFRAIVEAFKDIPAEVLSSAAKRLKNQADFYSLFGAYLNLTKTESLPEKGLISARLQDFFSVVVDESARDNNIQANRYFAAARSNSNDFAQRRDRISIVSDVLTGAWSRAGS
jgi:hypothetical protein